MSELVVVDRYDPKTDCYHCRDMIGRSRILTRDGQLIVPKQPTWLQTALDRLEMRSPPHINQFYTSPIHSTT